jgi:hypothetical protein
MTSMKVAYSDQKCNAKRRGIPFLLTLGEFIQWWMETGHVNERGRGKGKWQMGRINDAGPYALGNIIPITHERNLSDAGVFAKYNRTSEHHQRARQTASNRLLVECRAAQRVSMQEAVTCPHCNKLGRAAGMYRWHFERCKQKSPSFPGLSVQSA